MKPVPTPLAIFLISISITISICDARILNVPEDYQTIQAGIDAVESGDTVLVAERNYWVQLMFRRATPFTLASQYILDGDESHIRETILNTTYGDSSIMTFDSIVTRETRIVGFTLFGGHAENGGGIHCRNSSPSLEWLHIRSGSAPHEGGGVYVRGRSNPILKNCIISNNRAGYGGGLAVGFGARCELRECVIEENQASARGGGILISDNGLIEMTDCDVIGNINQGWGGAICALDHAGLVFRRGAIISNRPREGQQIAGGVIYMSESIANFYNVLIARNVGLGAVAATAGDQTSNLTMRSCTMFGNIDSSDSPTQFSGDFAVLSIANCILRGFGESIAASGFSSWSTIIFNDVENLQQESFRATNLIVNDNIDADPLFLDPDNGDYHLTANSPCIDASDPEAPHDPDGTRADIGAFHFHQRDIVASPDSIPFGRVFVGETVGHSLFLFNDGGTNLQIRTIDLSGRNFSFADDDRPYLIAPFTEHEILLFFTPEDSGDFNGAIMVVSNDADEDTLIISLSGRGEWPNAVPADTPQSAIFNLHSAYPNPFNGQTTIRFSTGPINREATLRVYGLDGRLVEELWTGRDAYPTEERQAGARPINQAEQGARPINRAEQVTWNAEGLPGGVYIVRLEAGKDVRTMKAILLR